VTDGRLTDATRGRCARAFCVLVLSAQIYCVLDAYRDPLKRFGFQPFSESTSWQVRIWAVDRSATRTDVSQGLSGYRWQDLVHDRVGNPFGWAYASSGIATSLYFLQHALDYVADHTPRDTRTRYLEAEVSYRRNRGPERRVTLRSKQRSVP
jgi:hypothetical protein